jgi:hypothetical protein
VLLASVLTSHRRSRSRARAPLLSHQVPPPLRLLLLLPLPRLPRLLRRPRCSSALRVAARRGQLSSQLPPPPLLSRPLRQLLLLLVLLLLVLRRLHLGRLCPCVHLRMSPGSYVAPRRLRRSRAP